MLAYNQQQCQLNIPSKQAQPEVGQQKMITIKIEDCVASKQVDS
jgi:hypothetical protein